METYIALLRGVNVGGNNKLPMKILSTLCEAQGCSGVRTYIQSGNVVFRAGDKVASKFPSKLTSEIKKELGFEPKVILRTAAELQTVVKSNPYLTANVDTKFLHVMFLADEPDLTKVVKLDPECEGGEAFSLRGREIFLYLPNGAGRSKLASYAFDKVLGTAVSTRNWNTVQKLLSMCEEIREPN
jgi:uncharacterized protein (DUF1697 family)